LSGNLQIVMADGSIQYIYYDPDDDEDFEGFDIVPGQTIPDLRIVTLKKVGSPVSHVSRVVDELLRANVESVKRFEGIEKSLSLIAKMLESNGKANALPAQPAPAFVNPMAAYVPTGCFHHPECLVSKSTLAPCLLTCRGSNCVHNVNCKPVVPEAAPNQRGKNWKKKKNADESVAVDKPLSSLPASVPAETLAVKQSAVPSNPIVETSPQILYSVVVVEGAGATAFGIYTDRGVITQAHIIEGGDTIKVYPPYAPANSETFPRSAVVVFPGDAELILLPMRVSNCAPVSYKTFAELKGMSDGPEQGAVVCPIAVTNGRVSYKPNCPTELLIAGGTKAGMCGSPYVCRQKIVGFHAFGNNNKKDNGAFAVTPDFLKWLNLQPKN